MFKAIIVDDEIDIRQGLLNIVDWQKHGFDIAGQASNGFEALKLFKSQRPGLIVTDIRMPEMDGLALIKEIAAIDSDVKIIILSGYNDFTYAREAMKFGVTSYLLKPVDVEELHQELNSIRESISSRLATERIEAEKAELLKNLFLFKFAHGEIKEENTAQQLKEYGLSLDFDCMCVAMAEFDDYREYEINHTTGEISLIKLKIKRIIEEILTAHKCGYLFEESESRYGLLLGAKETAGQNYLKSVLAEISNCIKVYSQENISISMGNTVYLPENMNISYKQALKALDRKLFSQKKLIFCFEDKDEYSEISMVSWNNKALMESLHECNRDKAVREVDQLFNELQERSISMSAVRYFITDIFTGIARLVLKYNGDLRSIRSKYFMESTDVLKKMSAKEIRKYTEDVCIKICDFVESEKQKSSENIIDKVLQYIDEHFFEDINLKKLSDLFFINQFYLGQLIKKKKGMNFNDYINIMRIENAKRLLHDGSLSIKDISERIGYKYVEHFYKNFKEITGSNPGEFRKCSPIDN